LTIVSFRGNEEAILLAGASLTKRGALEAALFCQPSAERATLRRNDRMIAITSWLAWLVAAVIFATIASVIVVISLLHLGAAVTIATVLLFGLLLALALAIVTAVLRIFLV
jgi:hypothetical protein